jgi:hypothetical protein
MGGRASSTQSRLKQQLLSAAKNRDNITFGSTGKFPSCFGKYPDCPAEAKAFAESKNKEGFKKENAPRNCRLCPFFKW